MGCCASKEAAGPAPGAVEMGAGHDHLPADVRAKREQVKEAIGTIVPEGGWPDWLLDGDIESAQQYVMNYAVYLNSKHSGWGTAPPGASRAGAIRYLKAALEALGDKQDKRFKEPVFWLLSNSRLWPSDAHRGLTEADPVFDDIQAMAKSRLDPLGEKYESEVYVGKGFGALMGHLGSDIGQSAHPRQDTHGTLYFPKNEKIDEIYGGFSGFVYLYMLRIACEAIDKQFQAKSAAALSTIKGFNATNVDTMNQTAPLVLNKSPHPKGTMRMWAKYNSDHSEADLPKCAENADCNRDAWVVDSSLMCEAYEEAARIFGKPIRVKNNLSPDFDARTRASGYRCILANYGFDTGKTWGELKPEIDSATETVRDDLYAIYARCDVPRSAAEGEGDWIEAAGKLFMCDELRDVPAKLVVEIQFMTPEYYEMRKLSHAWYKIVRADDSFYMVNDYMGSLKDD